MSNHDESATPVTTTVRKYGEYEENGELYQAWIDGEATTDKVARCNLKYEDLNKLDGNLCLEMDPPEEYELAALEYSFHLPSGLLQELRRPRIFYANVWKRGSEDRTVHDMSMGHPLLDDGWDLSWFGIVAKSVVSLEYLDQTESPDRTHMSEITDAVYHGLFPNDTLRYIFVRNIVNKDTCVFLRDHIYTRSNGFYTFSPTLMRVPQEWKYDTPEYKALLATTLGKVVASYVLGHYEPGTVFISSIRTALEGETESETFLPDAHVHGYIPHLMFTLSHDKDHDTDGDDTDDDTATDDTMTDDTMTDDHTDDHTVADDDIMTDDHTVRDDDTDDHTVADDDIMTDDHTVKDDDKNDKDYDPADDTSDDTDDDTVADDDIMTDDHAVRDDDKNEKDYDPADDTSDDTDYDPDYDTDYDPDYDTDYDPDYDTDDTDDTLLIE